MRISFSRHSATSLSRPQPTVVGRPFIRKNCAARQAQQRWNRAHRSSCDPLATKTSCDKNLHTSPAQRTVDCSSLQVANTLWTLQFDLRIFRAKPCLRLRMRLLRRDLRAADDEPRIVIRLHDNIEDGRLKITGRDGKPGDVLARYQLAPGRKTLCAHSQARTHDRCVPFAKTDLLNLDRPTPAESDTDHVLVFQRRGTSANPRRHTRL